MEVLKMGLLVFCGFTLAVGLVAAWATAVVKRAAAEEKAAGDDSPVPYVEAAEPPRPAPGTLPAAPNIHDVDVVWES